MQKWKIWFTSLTGCLFLMTLAVVLMLNFRFIYYYDISAQNLVEVTGYSKEMIRRNYDILIDYNLIGKGVKLLEFPDFAMSEAGKIHFEEVRMLFLGIQYICLVSGLLFVICIVKQVCAGEYRSLKMTAILTITVPIILGTLAVGFWDTVFVVFHKICFRNDYWLFDPASDPVINILPDIFFFHCAITIMILILTGGLLCLITYGYFLHRDRKLLNSKKL